VNGYEGTTETSAKRHAQPLIRRVGQADRRTKARRRIQFPSPDGSAAPIRQRGPPGCSVHPDEISYSLPTGLLPAQRAVGYHTSRMRPTRDGHRVAVGLRSVSSGSGARGVGSRLRSVPFLPVGRCGPPYAEESSLSQTLEVNLSEAFDPYYTWLAIPPEEQPPDYYRLLGLRPFEENKDAIAIAASQRMTHFRSVSMAAADPPSTRAEPAVPAKPEFSPPPEHTPAPAEPVKPAAAPIPPETPAPPPLPNPEPPAPKARQPLPANHAQQEVVKQLNDAYNLQAIKTAPGPSRPRDSNRVSAAAIVGWVKRTNRQRLDVGRGFHRAIGWHNEPASAAHRDVTTILTKAHPPVTAGGPSVPRHGGRCVRSDAAGAGWWPCSGGPSLRSQRFRLGGCWLTACRCTPSCRWSATTHPTASGERRVGQADQPTKARRGTGFPSCDRLARRTRQRGPPGCDDHPD
jgi:outer membrane biosynthesis protein TonB